MPLSGECQVDFCFEKKKKNNDERGHIFDFSFFLACVEVEGNPTQCVMFHTPYCDEVWQFTLFFGVTTL